MFHRYVAIGDSTTEGLDDPDGRGGYRGWADRFAELVAGAQGELLYANLAIRGRTTRRIRDEQLAAALDLRPDLATVVSGVNDLLRVSFDGEAIAEDQRAMISALVGMGATVLTFTMPDLSPVMPLARPLRRRLEKMNQRLREVGKDAGAIVVDFAAYPVGSDARLWSEDRLHANSLGHERVAQALADAIRLPGSDASWKLALPTPPRRGPRAALAAELAWTRRHLAPWLARHLRGHSSGDDRKAKRPELLPVAR